METGNAPWQPRVRWINFVSAIFVECQSVTIATKLFFILTTSFRKDDCQKLVTGMSHFSLTFSCLFVEEHSCEACLNWLSGIGVVVV